MTVRVGRLQVRSDGNRQPIVLHLRFFSQEFLRFWISAAPHADLDLVNEKFAKLLLGEDMSGTGKGVSSALALSNAITNLAASIFGEQRRLEPMSAERRTRWNKEIDWLLSVTDHIVEFAPSQQVSEDGTNMEVQPFLTLIPPSIRTCNNCNTHTANRSGDGHPAAHGSPRQHPRLAKARRHAPGKHVP